MPLTLNSFLSILGTLKEYELDSDEKFSIITNLQVDNSEYNLKYSEWLYNELILFNEYKKVQVKLNNEINSNHHLPSETLPFESIDMIVEWLYFIGLEDEWDIIEDNILCKLNNDLSFRYEKRFNQFYSTKLNQLKINPTEIRRNLFPKIQLIEKKEDKVIFNEFFEYLKDFHPYPLPKQEVKIEESTHIESKSKIPIELNCHPFHNNDVRDFHLYLESKYPNEINNTKSIFGAFWKFFEREGLIDSNEKKRIMKNYIDWINKRFDFQGDELITKLQTNTKSFPLSAFEKHYDKFEESKGDSFRFHDFRDENIQRTKKKGPSK